MRLSLRLYRLLLRLYPAGFREEFNLPLERQFNDDYAELRRPMDYIRFWGRMAADLVKSAPPQLASELAQDATHAFRVWRRNPWPTAFAILVLAVAIGANTGVFSVLNALVLRSLPFREPGRLVSLSRMDIPRTGFHAWREEVPWLADAATYDTLDVNVDGAHLAGRMRLTETSSNFFPMLGASAALGRTFAPGEDLEGAGNVAVIGHALWQQLFGADPRVVGSSIRVNGTPLTVIGVAAPGFDYPQRTDIWSPTTFDFRRIPKTGSAIFFYRIGRLKPGWSWQRADEAAKTAAARAAGNQPIAEIDRRAIRPLQDDLAGPVRRASSILMAGVGLLLLLACAHLANLMLSRTVGRSHELMIRTALGASRGRLTQQLLTESVLLSIVATLAGLLVATWTAAVATAVQPPQIASQSYTILDWRVLAFAVALSGVTGMVFGVGPALYVGRRGFADYGKASAVTSRSGARTALIGAQVAITIVLVTGSIALGQAFLSLLRIDIGYDLESIATMNVSIAGSSHSANGRGAAYYEDVIRRVRDVPGVTAVSTTESLPLALDAIAASAFQLDGAGPESPRTVLTSVSPGYFATIGSPVIAGREFEAQDRAAGAERVTVVNEAFARAFGGPSKVLGRYATNRYDSSRIVGVVRDMRMAGPAFEPGPQVFSLSRSPRATMIVAKVAGRARDRIGVIREAVQSIDPRVPVFNVKTMDDRLAETLARPKFYTTAVTFFGGLAFLIAIIGIYGAVSYAVAQRTREMGIRLALGTTPSRLRAAILRQTLVVLGAGAVAGVLMAAGAGRYLQTLVEGADGGMTWSTAAAVLATLGVATAATWRATRHVARLDVTDVLRRATE